MVYAERPGPIQARTLGEIAWSEFGNLTRTTDNAGNQINVTYDSLGRKTQLSDPDLGVRIFNVDALGQVYSQTDAKGQTSTFIYDALRRMTSRTEGGTETGAWTYGTGANCKVGRLCTATAPGYSRNHSYDALARLTGTTTAFGGQTFTSTQQYDGYGRLQAIRHTQGGRPPVVVGYGYNAQGRFAQLAGLEANYWRATAGDGVDHVTSETLGDSLVTNRGYHAQSARLSSITTGPGGGNAAQLDTYGWDSNGNLLSRSNRGAIHSASNRSDGFSANLARIGLQRRYAEIQGSAAI